MRRLTAEEFLRAEQPPTDASLEGPDLERVFWALRGRQLEHRRKEAFWDATSEALDQAFRDLDELNLGLEARVKAQVQEIVEHSRTVEALNAELRVKIQDRSLHLAEALRKLALGAAESELRRGDLFGERVRIERFLGRGGMGVVYLATDTLTGKEVALKVLRRSVRGKAAMQRFLLEARAATAAAHPAITRTLHVDVTEDGRLYQLMDYVPGVTLETRLVCGPLSSASTARIGSVIADALAAAHRSSVTHRDIKPSNLALSELAPGVRIFDFGIATTRDDDGTGFGRNSLLGTPHYMSPEQIRDASRVGPASDVYSLGAVLFETLTGRPPFCQRDTDSICLGHLQSPPPDPRELVGNVPEDLAKLVLDCLAKRATDRPTAATLARLLTEQADRMHVPPSLEQARIEIERIDAVRLAATAALDGDP